MINTNEELIVVDVREEDEYCDIEPPTPSVPHIPGALNYPWWSNVLHTSYSELPLDGDILVVCRSGGRSAYASDFLCNDHDFTSIYNMTGGMLAWADLGLEVVGCIDSDSDNVNDDLDNCPEVPNGPEEGTCTKGTIGHSCTADGDCGTNGFCSKDQEDNDQDGTGDVCDDDIDGDGFLNNGDNCPTDYNPGQEDTDEGGGDGLGDVCDICPDFYNPGQEDILPPGGNGCGDLCECEGDFEGDGDVDGRDVAWFKTDAGREDCETDSP